MTKKKFPKELFVHTEVSHAETWLANSETLGDGLSIGESRLEGRYVLQEVVQVAAEMKIDRRGKR